jgi:hypothetical protein
MHQTTDTIANIHRPRPRPGSGTQKGTPGRICTAPRAPSLAPLQEVRQDRLLAAWIKSLKRLGVSKYNCDSNTNNNNNKNHHDK